MNQTAEVSSNEFNNRVEGDDGAAPITWVQRLTWIGESKLKIVGFALGVGVLTAGSTFLLPPVFTARTTLLPPNNQQASGAAAAMAALGGLAGAVGGVKTPDELYVTLLKSDSVTRPIADQFDLRKRYEADSFDDVRRAMAKHVRVSSEKKTGVITVEVDDEQPEFAARLANAHTESLIRLLSRLAVSEAQQRRVFFTKQLEDTNASLLKAEQNLKQFQQKSGLIVLDKQAEALISSAAQLRAQIAEREVRLRVLRTTATDQNPEAIRLISELQGLRGELKRLDAGNASGDANKSPLDLPVRGIPEAASDYVRALREVKYQEAVFQSMLKQLEVAKLDEAKEGNTVQQIDIATPPERKSRPARGLITATATLAAMLMACLATIVRGYNRVNQQHRPTQATALRTLRKAWSIRLNG